MAMHLRPEERPGHNAPIRRPDTEQAEKHLPACRGGCLGSQLEGKPPVGYGEPRLPDWGLRRPEAGVDPRHPGSVSRSGSDSRPIPEARAGEAMYAGRAGSDGCDENSGNARREGPCVPRPTAVARPVGGPSPATPRGPDMHALPATAGLAVAGAGGATERAAFPDPPSDVLHASAGLAVEKAWSATQRVAFPHPPSDALRLSAGLAVEAAAGATDRVAFTDPPSATPDPGKTRKAGSPNEPGKGRTGKSPPHESPERTWQRKNRQVRHVHEHRPARVFGLRRRADGVPNRPQRPAAYSRLERMAQRKSKPPCRKLPSCPGVATRAPDNRQARRNRSHGSASHVPRPGAGGQA
jgi:hypothetical protein